VGSGTDAAIIAQSSIEAERGGSNGYRDHLNAQRDGISNAIHASAVAEPGLPEGTRFHRFISPDSADVSHPGDRRRSPLIAVPIVEGGRWRCRRGCCGRWEPAGGLVPQAVEITITGTPRRTWGAVAFPPMRWCGTYVIVPGQPESQGRPQRPLRG